MEFQSIHNLLDRWARWRLSGNYNCLGFGISFLQKCLEGMPGTNCPTCAGTGRVPGKLYGLPHMPKVECLTCGGDGRVKMDPGGSKINPAFIRETFHGSGHPIYEQIDRLVCELGLHKKTEQLYKVIMAEYCRTHGSGTQAVIAKRMNMSHSMYRKTLERARRALEVGLDSCHKNAYKRVSS